MGLFFITRDNTHFILIAFAVAFNFLSSLILPPLWYCPTSISQFTQVIVKANLVEIKVFCYSQWHVLAQILPNTNVSGFYPMNGRRYFMP